MRRPIIAVVVSVAVVFGLVWVGHFARRWLEQRQHYTVNFVDLHCPVPPGVGRDAFLIEVQYFGNGNLPDRINLLDPDLVNRLQAAFSLHPWVEKVEGIDLRGPDGPTVRLVMRTPALAVGDRVVDRHGVLLPAKTPTAGLPVYPKEAPLPKGPAGTPWGDPDVEKAARSL
jgi:hypothetical protein